MSQSFDSIDDFENLDTPDEVVVGDKRYAPKSIEPDGVTYYCLACASPILTTTPKKWCNSECLKDHKEFQAKTEDFV